MNQVLLEKTVTVDGKTHKVSDLLRKVYSVEESQDEVLWEEVARYDNSTEANAARDNSLADAEFVRVRVVEVTSTPKSIFWQLWRTKEGKSALKSIGVFVTKWGDNYVVTDRKPSRGEILSAKGYRRPGPRDHDFDYYLVSKCRGEFDALEAEGYHVPEAEKVAFEKLDERLNP